LSKKDLAAPALLIWSLLGNPIS